MKLDETNTLVASGAILIVVVGSWVVVGSVLVWALWQLLVFYALLVVVAAVVYGALYIAVGLLDGGSSRVPVIGE